MRASEFTGQKRFLLLYGAPKHGKTVCAATMSDKFPEELPSKEQVYLDDLFFMEFDPNGLQSLISLGLDTNGEDLSMLTNLKEIDDGVKACIARVETLAKEKKVRAVIIDTLTFLDAAWTNALSKLYPDPKDGQRMFGHLKVLHQDFAGRLRHLPCWVIAVAHTKAAFSPVATDESIDIKQKVTGLDSSVDIDIAITGQSAGYWKGTCDALLPVICKRVGKVSSYIIRPNAGNSFAGGSRFVGLSDEEPANLRKLLTKANARLI